MKTPRTIKIISRTIEFKGWHSLETVAVQPSSLKHDGHAAPMTREVYICKKSVVLLLYLPETDQILLNQQFRMGAFIAGDDHPFLYECCGGIIDEGEDPEEAARREAVEETGCDILDLEFVGKAYPSPGGSTEQFLLYCGRVAQATPGHYGLDTESEEIKTHLFTTEEALRLLDTGSITNGGAVILLHWFARNHQRLRQKWGQK